MRENFESPGRNPSNHPTMSSGKNTSTGSSNYRRSSQPTKTKFKPPTVGLENVVFDYNGIGKSAVFKEHLNALARYVDVMFKYESPTMSKAIKELKAPTFNEPPESSENAGVAFEKWKVVHNKLNKEKEAYKKNNEVFFDRLGRCSGHVPDISAIFAESTKGLCIRVFPGGIEIGDSKWKCDKGGCATESNTVSCVGYDPFCS